MVMFILAIFDGRKDTYFDMIVSEALLEIYAWKISTITPFFTYMFALDEDRISYATEFLMNFKLGDGLTLATVRKNNFYKPSPFCPY
jgi:hypothetical protein